MTAEEKLVGALVRSAQAFGLQPPAYPKPKWYQFGLRRKLRYYDKVGWPYTLV